MTECPACSRSVAVTDSVCPGCGIMLHHETTGGGGGRSSASWGVVMVLVFLAGGLAILLCGGVGFFFLRAGAAPARVMPPALQAPAAPIVPVPPGARAVEEVTELPVDDRDVEQPPEEAREEAATASDGEL